MTDFKAPYSAAERLIHDLAFSQTGLQRALSRIEDRVFKSTLDTIDEGAPVFITSLPRAGTTVLLNVLCSDATFVAHSYRHMPFLLCPLIWNKATAPFWKKSMQRERAHSDGMSVGFDSPEAFDEIIWQEFWPQHYTSDRITPWDDCGPASCAEFAAFLRQHMRKIIALAQNATAAGNASRFISKNNANIARLTLLRTLFPDCVLLVPFREPGSQAASLLNQHKRFLNLHGQDAFATRYMRAIGHFEFGALHKPIEFPGWRVRNQVSDPLRLDYWFDYWIACFEQVLQSGARPVLISYDRLCSAPKEGLAALVDHLGLNRTKAILPHAQHFREPAIYKAVPPDVSQARISRAEAVHDALLAAAIN